MFFYAPCGAIQIHADTFADTDTDTCTTFQKNTLAMNNELRRDRYPEKKHHLSKFNINGSQRDLNIFF